MDVVQLLAGDVTLPPQHPRAGDPYPLFAYLIRHPEGAVLVDTGCGPGHGWVDEHFAPADIPIDRGLAAAGVSTADVIMIIHTHLHFDHCGQDKLFPGVPVVAQQADFDAAREPGFTLADWLGFDDLNWRLVDGEVEVLPGVRVLPTASHTPGHQAVVVEGDDGVEVIAGQAVQDGDELEMEASNEDLPRSGAEGFDVVAQRIKALGPVRVWFSHDERPWEPE
jgi:glyoxylase-like metal-dependent hydrolase (beta-lactamase superfamily II)